MCKYFHTPVNFLSVSFFISSFTLLTFFNLLELLEALVVFVQFSTTAICLS